MISPAIPLARMTKPALQDEWVRVRRFARTARTGTVREHAAAIMKAIELELAQRAARDKLAAFNKLAAESKPLAPEFAQVLNKEFWALP